MPRPLVALCNELGEGRGHFVPLREIGLALTHGGYEIRYFTSRPDLAKAVGIPAQDIIHVPWKRIDGEPSAEGRPASAVTFGDALLDLVYRSDEMAMQHIGAWFSALNESGCGVVVADYSPSALLASRGIRPRIAYGNGFTLPPANVPFYPRLWRAGGGPVHEERGAVARLNSVLKVLGVRPIDRFPQVMEAEHALIFCPPIMDPYGGLRPGAHLGNLYSQWIDPSAGSRDLVFAYFRGSWARDARLHEALSAVGGGVFALNGVNEDEIAKIGASGSKVVAGLVDMQEMLPRTRLLVHYGGGGLVFSGILSGIPQIIIHTDIEKYLNGEKLADAGAARLLEWNTFQAGELVKAISAAYTDEALKAAAQRVARENSRYAKFEGVERVVQAVRALA